MLNLGFLASHEGSTMQHIVEACRNGRLDALPRVVISNNRVSVALVRAGKEKIPAYHLSALIHPDPEVLDDQVKNVLQSHQVDVVILAGYMRKIGPRTIEAFRGRILNTHPALLPKHGGRGMFGGRVHEAVLASGDSWTGATVHVIDENYDTGPILNQRRTEVRSGDTVESLSERVKEVERELYVETLQRIAAGEIKLGA